VHFVVRGGIEFVPVADEKTDVLYVEAKEAFEHFDLDHSGAFRENENGRFSTAVHHSHNNFLVSSGFIDLSELAFLCAELGEALDRYVGRFHNVPLNVGDFVFATHCFPLYNACSTQLAEAFKLLDKNNDRKIDFDEFFEWWRDQEREKGGKSGLALAGVRGQLLIHRGQRYICSK
jgi:hypothetical protein